MKIVLVNYRYFVTSGAETFMFKFKALLEEKGHEVIPFSTVNPSNVPTEYEKYFANGRSRGGAVLYSEIRKTPANIYRMLAGAFYNPDAKKKLRVLLRGVRPDIVFVLQEMNALSPSIFDAAREEGIPVVYRQSDFHLFCPRYDCLCDGEPCVECLKRKSYKPAVEKRCVKNSLSATLVRCGSMSFHKKLGVFNSISAFVAPARFTCELLAEAGFPREKIVHIPTFIDSSHITPRYDGDGYFIFLGRLSPEKGIDDLLRAMSLMEHSEARLKLLGWGEDEYIEQLRSLVSELGLEERVVFSGFKSGSELEAEISGATALVHPARWFENMPNCVLEAYAYGKSVVASDIGSMPEFVEDGVTGLLCRPGDPVSLAKKLDIILSDIALTERMGRNARALCAARFAPEPYYEKMMQLFERVVSENNGNRKEKTADRAFQPV